MDDSFVNGTMERETPAWRLFHHVYDVVLPMRYAYEAKFKLEGTPAFENKKESEEFMNEQTRTRRTVVELIGLHKRGCPIIFANPLDTVKAYKDLAEHLEIVRNRVISDLRIKPVPLNDLKDMDDFATLVYRVARTYMPDEESEMEERLKKSMSVFRSRGIQRRPKSETTSETAAPKAEREHQSLLNNIAATIISKNIPVKGSDNE